MQLRPIIIYAKFNKHLRAYEKYNINLERSLCDWVAAARKLR